MMVTENNTEAQPAEDHDDFSYSDSYSFHRVSSAMKQHNSSPSPPSSPSLQTVIEQDDNKKKQAYPLLTVQYAQLEQRCTHCLTELQSNAKRSPGKAMALLVSFTLLVCWSASPLGRYYNPNDTTLLMQSHRNVRHAMKSGGYSQLEVAYNFRMADIPTNQWCLFGASEDSKSNTNNNNNKNECPFCEDPTHADHRHEFPAWTQPHTANIAKVTAAKRTDVVFVGDETVQAWEGRAFNQRCAQSEEIVGHWNRTIGASASKNNNINAMTLGLSGDRITHVLWRLQHGEMPTKLMNAKVIWLILGSRDLAVRFCSEEVVTLGILRVAEEIKQYNPQAKIILQSILPRTHHKDGSLESAESRPLKHQGLVYDRQEEHAGDDTDSIPSLNNDRHTTDYGEADEGLEAMEEDEERKLHLAEPKYDYYLWPSIQTINRQVKHFCDTHDGFEFFDVTQLFLTSRANDRSHLFIQRELLREYAQLSGKGHGVLLDAIQKKVWQLLQLDDGQ